METKSPAEVLASLELPTIRYRGVAYPAVKAIEESNGVVSLHCGINRSLPIAQARAALKTAAAAIGLRVTKRVHWDIGMESLVWTGRI